MPISKALLSTLEQKRQAAYEAGGEEKLAERRKKGLLTARDRITALFEANTFMEWGLHAQHDCHNFGMEGKALPGDGVITGVGYIELLEKFEKDRATDAVVIIGEIGGEAEEEAAAYIKKHVAKRVVAFIAGRTAPPEKKMGHAGAIISGDRGTAESKIKAFSAAGVKVVDRPDQIPAALRGSLEAEDVQ